MPHQLVKHSNLHNSTPEVEIDTVQKPFYDFVGLQNTGNEPYVHEHHKLENSKKYHAPQKNFEPPLLLRKPHDLFLNLRHLKAESLCQQEISESHRDFLEMLRAKKVTATPAMVDGFCRAPKGPTADESVLAKFWTVSEISAVKV